MASKNKQKFCDFLFLDAEIVFDILKKFFISEVRKMKKKEKEYEGIWKFINNFKVRDSFSEEFKIVTAVVFIIVSAIWIGNRNTISIVRSDDSEITNAQTKAINVDVKEAKETDSNEKKADIKAAVEFKLESSEKSCEKSKEKKISSDLCGEDDKEMVKKIEEEKKKENRVWEANSKPKVVNLSCPEKNYGHPSESDNKGKHMDEDCCPDPDEWPKPRCVYDAHGYSIMLKGPK